MNVYVRSDCNWGARWTPSYWIPLLQHPLGECTMLRLLALRLPVLLAMVVGIAVQAQAQNTSNRYSDFSYLTSDLRSLEQRVEDFITEVRAGNRQAYKYVTYETLEAAVVRLKREADNYRGFRGNQAEVTDRTMTYLVMTTASDEEQARKTLARATLPGIFNLDPRVRLVATDWLRGLRPDPSMQRAVKLAVGVDVEVIRYDHTRNEFVFRAPRILETVASPYEYLREKDLDWPTSFQVGGAGPNNNEELLYQGAPQLRDGPNVNTTTGLSARRWGAFAPRYDQDRGYVPLTQAEMDEVYKSYKEALELAEARAQARYGGDVFAPELDRYRRYPNESTRDLEGVRRGAGLLMEQSGQQGQMVPLGQGDKYIYLDRFGHIVLGSPWTELTKLDEYITRLVWWDKLKGANGRNVITYLSKDTFSTLFRSIDGEVPSSIPMLSFATNLPMIERDNAQVTDRIVDTFIVGLHRNPVLSNKYVLLRALKDIYVDKFGVLDTTPATQQKINVAMWEFRREANRLDYVAGQILTAESITVGKRNPAEWTPIGPVSQVQEDAEEETKFGFCKPNDEIRASSFRLISTSATNSSDNTLEPKVNIDDLFRSRFYAYQREDGSTITWYNNRTEWTNRAAGKNITDKVDQITTPWIYDYDQMTRAQAIINGILVGDGEILRTALWKDVESAIILTLKRVQLMYDINPAGQGCAPGVVTTFMDQLRTQDVVVRNPAARQTDGRAVAGAAGAGDPALRSMMFVNEEELARQGKYALNTYTPEKRESIKQAALGAIFNRDPRIRLTGMHFLRRIGPDESMLDAIIRARSIAAGVDPARVEGETDDYLNMFIDTNLYERLDGRVAAAGAPAGAADGNPDYQPEILNRYRGVIPDEQLEDKYKTLVLDILHPAYTEENNEFQMGLRTKLAAEQGDAKNVNGLVRYFGLYQLKSPGEELDKLYRFIQRRRLVRAIKRGDVNAITRMSRTDFGILSEFIDDEYAARVPFASFHTTTQDRSGRTALPSKYAVFNEKDIAVIKRGVDSTNFLVQKGTAEYLTQFYNFYTGFSPDSPVKKEIRDAMYFYKQDDIVVEEFVLAFEGEDPDGRAVIMAGTPLSRDLNPGGERVYRTLPNNILMDIRDAVLDETYRLPDSLRAILGMITTRATEAGEPTDFTYTSRDQNATVRTDPEIPAGPQVTPPPSRP